jgi:hypothetical protein
MPPPRYPLARLSPAKNELLLLGISYDAVVQCDTRPLLETLHALSATARDARHWEGKVSFVFEGWDADPRETSDIPEIRAFFDALTEQWPYWFHFAEKVEQTIPHVLRLLCRGHTRPLSPGLVGWRMESLAEFKRVMSRLFAGLNVLYKDLDLPASDNERISQEVVQLVECAFC